MVQCFLNKQGIFLEMFSDDQHVMSFAVLLQLTQQTHFITPDKEDSIPLMFTQLHEHPKQLKGAKTNSAKSEHTV